MSLKLPYSATTYSATNFTTTCTCSSVQNLEKTLYTKYPENLVYSLPGNLVYLIILRSILYLV